ncbi:replication-relaxation family protein [Streptomyces sp. 5-6(2022)]|uniref:replication-relaxation family protein n=1 Tax=Streptomyces sp. 5-6(2022) TaxID=2936510 RepID=UPI0023B8C1DB|nr:replication-relaxation family protein [Streptomyces sp. 5-6(2022)]
MITNPTPQRTLRGHMPQRSTPRSATTSDHLARLAKHLTPRDRWLMHMLFEHKVFTSHQIAALAWPTTRAANLRLLSLYKWRVLDRFQPFVTAGSAPMHYVLDTVGATFLAREDGLDLHELGYRHDRAIGIAHSLRLAHTVGVNTFFTVLSARTRRADTDGELTAWWSEARCHKHFGDIVRPDAYGRWRQHSTEIEWFLEYDFGTEPLSVVARKVSRYARLAATTGITTPVLLWMPSTRRENGARRALTAAMAALDEPSLVPLATTSADLVAHQEQSDPAVARWLPLDTANSPRRRLELAELSHAWPHLAPITLANTGTTTSSPPPAPVAPAPPSAQSRR